MDKLVESIIQAAVGLCKDLLRGKELPEFLGYLFSWEMLEEKLPENLRRSNPKNTLSVSTLRRVWPSLATCDSLGTLSHAFAFAADFPFERLSDYALSELAFRVSMTSKVLEPTDRVQLAAWIVNNYFELTKTGEQTFPREVAKFLFDQVSVKKGESVLCPQPNAEWFAIEAMQAGVLPHVIGASPPMLIGMFAAITGNDFDYLNREYVAPGDRDLGELAHVKALLVAPPFGPASDRTQEMIYMQSQFGARSTEAFCLERALQAEGQKSVVVVSNSFLFRTGPEQGIRERLAESGHLEAVIGFPSGLLSFTNIPFSAVLVSASRPGRGAKICKIDDEHVDGKGKLRAHKRRFVGGREVTSLLKKPDGRSCKTVKLDELRSHDYRLVPEQYLEQRSDFFKQQKNSCRPLSDLVDIVKPQLLRSETTGKGTPVREVSPGEMPRFSYLTGANRERVIERSDLDSRGNQRIQSGDILLSTKGTIGKVGIALLDSKELPVVPSLSSVILRPKIMTPIRDPRYLVVYLRSPAVQQLLNSMAVGAVIRNIPLGALRALPVWVPPDNEQRQFVEVFERQAGLEKRALEIVHEQEDIESSLWQSVGLEDADGETATTSVAQSAMFEERSSDE